LKRAQNLYPAESWCEKTQRFCQGEYPIFIEYGKGGRITDVDGNEYIDFLCGYGPIILGYREEEVDEAVVRQIKDKGFCFTLTQRYQNQVAKKLSELVPCSQMSIFLKTVRMPPRRASVLRGHTQTVSRLCAAAITDA